MANKKEYLLEKKTVKENSIP